MAVELGSRVTLGVTPGTVPEGVCGMVLKVTLQGIV